ncbi:MAG: hypothetical protein LQ342_003582 [Letrouitia transgressa]|nr:MAG: hypothetical protein LQ342_003582 [Letrouitia transgressa]
MRSYEAALLVATAASSVAAAEASRPRGVGESNIDEHATPVAKFYKPSDTFTCISNPSITISFSRLNDDYCDCPDGSDEPGTAACSYLSPLSPSYPSDISSELLNATLALPGYYCKNKGHQPSYIPFLAVNDGVCDYDLCCDGSDEWVALGGVKCENKCKEIGKEWKKQDEANRKSRTTAGKRRKELVAESKRLRKEVEDRIQSLQTAVEGATVRVRDAETVLAEAERQERGKVVKSPGKERNKVGVLAQLTKDRIEELRTSLMQTREQRDNAKARVEDLEGILATFKEEYNPNFNDEGVKRAVRSWEDYAARDKPAIATEAADHDLDEIVKPDGESGVINWSDWEKEEESDVDVLYKIEEYLPLPIRNWVDQKLRDFRILLVENGILAAHDSGSESKAVTDARNALKSAQDSENNFRNELSGHTDDLGKDYGPEDVFRALKGQCVSKDSGEYTYELCWFDKTTQIPKKGGGHTGMGNFVRIETATVDENLPLDGKGLGSGERMALKHENGQHCWSGPNRSTTVILGCAEQNEIWKITEEEKCVYRMEVGTPAVCEAGEGAPEMRRDSKDEL